MNLLLQDKFISQCQMFIYSGTSHKGTPSGPRVRVHLGKVEEKKNWCTRGHTMPQTCLLELLRPLVIVLSITGLLDVAFYI